MLFAAPSVPPPVTPYVDAGPDMTVDECYPVRLAGEGYDPAGREVVSNWEPDGSLESFDDAGPLHPLYATSEICGDCQGIHLGERQLFLPFPDSGINVSQGVDRCSGKFPCIGGYMSSLKTITGMVL